MIPRHHLLPRLLWTLEPSRNPDFSRTILGAVWLLVLVNLSLAAVVTVPSNYATIQGAIDAASEGDEIIVSPGTYYENININGKNIVLRSTDPTNPSVVATTIIDGSRADSVVTFSGTESPSCTLSGFTITNGLAQEGAGIYGDSTLTTILNNNITNNTASQGGGLCGCDGSIESNIIISNKATYGGAIAWCNGTIRNNRIRDNSATSDGGGVVCCSGIIEGNVISGSWARSTGGGLWKCSGIIQNNLISHNSAYEGGGLLECSGIFEGNTIVDNTASERGSALRKCYGIIANCIVWGNAQSSYQIYWSDMPIYSCVENGSGGSGNISNDPQFVDRPNGDYHLSPWSPCIDRGITYFLLPESATDIDGECRVSGWALDMGCDESGSYLDSDGDLLADVDEVFYGTDPFAIDTDGDGLLDGAEALRGTDPTLPDAPSGISVPADYPSVQQALFFALPLETVTVSPGAYYENLFFLGKDVTLRSADPLDTDTVSTTVLDGGAAAPVIAFRGTESAACAVQGLTIRNGLSYTGGGIRGNGTLARIEHNQIMNNLAFDPTPWDNAAGGGVSWCDGVVRSNLVSGNHADYGGGLSYCKGVIFNNIICGNETNSGGRGAGLAGCSGTIENNRICHNLSRGHGGGLSGCGGTMQNNIIEANQSYIEGGGLNDCWSIIDSNIVSGNISSIGGGLQGCQGSIENNIICGNGANWGGGLERCSGSILNNTICGNNAPTQGGGIRFCFGTIRNCIIWNNTSPLEPQVSFCDTPSYCCIQDWTDGGIGNISLDPEFVNVGNGNFRLLPTSPCIDAGGTVSLAHDFEGHPRPWDGTSDPRGDGSDFDIGAYEYCLEPTPTPVPFPFLSQRLPLAADVNGDHSCDLVQVMEDAAVGASLSSGWDFDGGNWCGYRGIWYDPEIGEFPLSGDVNGDGKDDLVQIKDWGDAWVALSTGTSFGPATRWGDPGIVFGRGILDPTKFWLPLIGDVDGDGDADLIQLTEFGDAWVSYSAGSAFPPAVHCGSFLIVYARGEVYPDRWWVPLIGDVDGDGDDDLIQITEYGEAWVAVSDGTAFLTAVPWGSVGIVLAKGSDFPTRYWFPLAGDINGDNKTDLVQVTEYGTVWVALSLGSSFEIAHYAGNPGFVCDPSIGWLPLIGDVNGDGCCDLIQITSTTPPGDIWVSLGPNFDSTEKWQANGDLCYSDTSGYPPPPQYRLNH